MISRHQQVRSSAIWAAYGDALGFVTELADSDRVQYRTGQLRVERAIAWSRKVGGRTGGSAQFPPGTYSDDTQLRLAVSRAIRQDGTFDVAAFAKVELPAWTCYALGAGVGSREAAANLARSSATWYSNFFESKRSSYFQGGGNGAAMRVQPHVWAAKDLLATTAILRDVIRNAVVTHGHPRGILGACFHALALANAMVEKRVPNLGTLSGLLRDLDEVPSVIGSDRDLRTFWLGRWLEHFPQGLDNAFAEAIEELRSDLRLLKDIAPQIAVQERYQRAVEALGGFNPNTRGSGTKTALLACFLADLYRDIGPAGAVIEAANVLGSDTDTIATMAGAILGAAYPTPCSDKVQDREYIEAEAERLSEVAFGKANQSFDYPDLRSWKPSRVAADVIYTANGELKLHGLGHIKPLPRTSIADGAEFILSWFELPFGQTILARSRLQPISLELDQEPSVRRSPQGDVDAAGAIARLPDLFGKKVSPPVGSEARKKAIAELTLHSQLQIVIASGFDKELVGQLLLAQVEGDGDDFIEKSVALASTIVTAYAARVRRNRK